MFRTIGELLKLATRDSRTRDGLERVIRSCLATEIVDILEIISRKLNNNIKLRVHNHEVDIRINLNVIYY